MVKDISFELALKYAGEAGTYRGTLSTIARLWKDIDNDCQAIAEVSRDQIATILEEFEEHEQV